MPLKTIEENVAVISDYFGGEKAPRGAVDHSALRLAIQSILVRADANYVAPSAEYGTSNVVAITGYDADVGAEVVPTLVGTGVVKDPGTGNFDNTASGSQFEIIAGGFENLDIDGNSGKLIISGRVFEDINNRLVTVRMTNGYYEIVEVVVDLTVTL